MICGYARVSTREQNEARQLDALTAAGIARRDIYLDKQSGKDFDRPQYQRLTMCCTSKASTVWDAIILTFWNNGAS